MADHPVPVLGMMMIIVIKKKKKKLAKPINYLECPFQLGFGDRSGNISTAVLQSLQACACSCPIHKSVVIIPCDQGSDHIPNYYILLGLIAFLAVNLSVHCPVVPYRKRCYSKWKKGGIQRRYI